MDKGFSTGPRKRRSRGSLACADAVPGADGEHVPPPQAVPATRGAGVARRPAARRAAEARRSRVEQGIAGALAEFESLEDALQAALKVLCSVLAWRAAGVWLDDDAGHLVAWADAGPAAHPAPGSVPAPDGDLADHPTDIAAGIAQLRARVPRVDRAALTDWLRREHVSLRAAATHGRHPVPRHFEGTEMAWVLPLYDEGMPSGFVVGIGAPAGAPDRDLARLLTTVAEQLGGYLQRTRSQEELLRFRVAMDMSGDHIYLVDRASMRYIDVNDAMVMASGFSRAELLQADPTLLTGLPLPVIEHWYDELIRSGESHTSEVSARGRDGEEGAFELRERALRLHGRWVIVGTARDIGVRRRAERAAETSRRMFAVLSATNEAILRADSSQALLRRVCQAAVQAGGFRAAALLVEASDAPALVVSELAGEGVEALRALRIDLDATRADHLGLIGACWHDGEPVISADYLDDPRTQLVRDVAEAAGVRSSVAVPLLRDGRVVAVLSLYATERDAFSGELLGLLERMAENIVYGLDVLRQAEQKREAEDRVQFLATHDGLTGLPNRALFNQLLGNALRNAARDGTSFAVLFIDLDRFKIINESLGHEAGDELLREVGARLTGTLRASDVVARLGGDEFVVLLHRPGDDGDIARSARRLIDVIVEPLSIRGQECRVTASIGVATYPGTASDEVTLMQCADVAMYAAKQEGKNGFRFYSDGMPSHASERLTLENNLRRALQNGEIFLHYQPKLDLRSGRIVGVEALVRWQSAQLGFVSPATFIPVAEETGLIVSIGMHVLREACAQAVRWRASGLPPLTMAVNLSARQFASEALLRDILLTLRETGMEPTDLELEITEGVVIQNADKAQRVLSALKRTGIRIAIDDFGTGYSSLGQLRRFPIDTLKIDRSFVRELPDNVEDCGIAHAIIAMAGTLGLTVVAEGVETREQAEFLREHGCDLVQGFFYSKPMAADLLRPMLEAQPHLVPVDDSENDG
jgi:diguanylate cyclase (GGDEF)-like protein/PAS domain S-box-containing protein